MLLREGDDRLDAGAGDDVVFAGAGRDVLVGGEGSDRLLCARRFQPFVAGFMVGAMLEQGLDPLNVDGTRAVLLPIGIAASAEFRLEARGASGRIARRRTALHLLQPRASPLRNLKFRPGECSLHFCASQGREAREEYSRRTFALESAASQWPWFTSDFPRVKLPDKWIC